MDSLKSFNMPNEFQPFQFILQHSICETAILKPSFIQPTTTQSKLAGYPYLPQGALPTLDKDGQPMLLLAQINFADIVAPKDFPTEGILQFFIAQNCYEHYTVEQSNALFSIRYYPMITNDMDRTTLHYLDDVAFMHFPIKHEQALFAHTELEPVSATDFRLTHYVDSSLLAQSFTVGGPTMEDLYFQYFLSADHKIGGYPYFIYEDIRTKNSAFRHYDTLLFQLISDDAQSIMWGDSGVISFFINAEKLKQCDFNDILFYAEDY